MLTPVWLRNEGVIEQTSECTKREFEKILGLCKLLQPHEKVCNENERKKKKQRARKNVWVHEWAPFNLH